EQDQIIAEVMTEKAAVELPSPVAGRVVRLCGAPGEVLKVGTPLIEFELPGGPEVPREESPAPAPANEASVGEDPGHTAQSAPVPRESHRNERRPSRIKASPATRRRAHEAGIDLNRIQGTGPGGRITAKDLAAAIDRPAAQSPCTETE